MWTLRAVRQSLEPRGIAVRRAEPYPDGRDKFEAFVKREPSRRVACDDPESLYVKAIKQLL